MKAILFLLLLMFAPKPALTQIYLTDVRDLGMGRTSVASIPIKGFSGNIAFIPEEKLSLINCGASNHFSIKQLSDFFLTYLNKINSNTSFRLNLCRSGVEHFSMQFIEAGLAKKLGNKFSAGISLQYHRQMLSNEYDASNTIIPTFGFVLNPLRKLSIGVVVRNPVRSRMNAIGNERLPAQINSGLSLKLSEKLSINTAAILQNDIPLSAGLGIEYHFHPILILRSGWHTIPESLSFGAGLHIKKFILDIAFKSHPVLGNSSAISFTFQL